MVHKSQTHLPSSGGVGSLNGETGDINLTSPDGSITITPNGQNIELETAGGSGAVTSVSGTTNRITSTGGTTPVIDISASYVGQASITTLGTIGTGTWAGTTVAVNHGGTGIISATNNGVMLGAGTGPFAFTGAPGVSGAVLRGSTLPGNPPAFGPLDLANTNTILSTSKLPALNGGTGIDGHLAGNGKLLIGNGSGYTLANLTAGTNVTITNSAGGITVAAASGAAPGGSSGDAQFNDGAGGFSGDAAFFWDNTNKRLGIGTSSPTDPLDLVQPGYSQGDGLKISDPAGLYAQFYHQAGNGLRMYDTNRFTFDSDVYFLAGVTIINALNLGSGVFNGGANFNGLFGVVDGLYVQDSTGLGTFSPLSKLDVNGNVAIGSSYAATVTAPTDGLIVQGKTGLGVTSPSAQLHLPAVTTSASTAPLKFTLGGTLMTTPEAGAVEAINSHVYWTDSGGTRLQLDRQVIAGSVSQVGAATTTFTVTIGATQPGTTYKVNVTPTNLLAAAVFYINNKTTTTFDVVYLAGLTGTCTFDWALFQ